MNKHKINQKTRLRHVFTFQELIKFMEHLDTFDFAQTYNFLPKIDNTLLGKFEQSLRVIDFETKKLCHIE
jgi:hypothetical protein